MAPSALKNLTQGIIEVLKADGVLSAEVKEWAFGEPTQETNFPIVWVQLMRGRSTWKSGNALQEAMWYEIIVKVRDTDRDSAETKVMDLFDRVKRVQKDDPTWGDRFRTSRLDTFSAAPSRSGDYAVARISSNLMVEREYA